MWLEEHSTLGICNPRQVSPAAWALAGRAHVGSFVGAIRWTNGHSLLRTDKSCQNNTFAKSQLQWQFSQKGCLDLICLFWHCNWARGNSKDKCNLYLKASGRNIICILFPNWTGYTTSPIHWIKYLHLISRQASEFSSEIAPTSTPKCQCFCSWLQTMLRLTHTFFRINKLSALILCCRAQCVITLWSYSWPWTSLNFSVLHKAHIAEVGTAFQE